MLALGIQFGARVRRRNDIGLDMPGAVVRVNNDEAMVYWPEYNFYELVPVGELERSDAIPELIAA